MQGHAAKQKHTLARREQESHHNLHVESADTVGCAALHLDDSLDYHTVECTVTVLSVTVDTHGSNFQVKRQPLQGIPANEAFHLVPRGSQERGYSDRSWTVLNAEAGTVKQD